MKIKSNYQARDVLTWYDLTPAEQKEFDYLSEGDGSFFRYKGNVYDLGEFLRIEANSEGFGNWHGYASDSFFSGVLVKYDNDQETVIAGTYYC